MTNKNNNIDAKIIRIRKLAGEIGSHRNIEKLSDSENYEFQVDTGLAQAVAHIQGFDPARLIYWFVFCLIDLDLEVDDRLRALLDALEREIQSQFYADEGEAA